jgi:hypothetical protein
MPTWVVLEWQESMMGPNRRRFVRISTIHTRSRTNRRTPKLEVLEERVVLSPTVIMVDSTADDGSGTLRSAIAQANAITKSAGSIIEFSSTVFSTPQTITLTGGSLNLTETAGPEVIQGPTVGVTINGNDTAGASVFVVGNGLTTIDASFSDLTITGGNANMSGTGSKGGGISNLGDLSLSECTIEGNYALNGGGVANGDQLTLDDCTITDNSSRGDGGGISSSGTITAVDTTISSNTVVNADGGGIYNNPAENPSATLTLTGCTISGNSAPEDAGLYSYSPANLTNCTISGNSASNYGGGVELRSTFTLDACTISDNSAVSGTGCGLSVDNGTLGTRNIEDTIIAGNTTGSSGSPSDLSEAKAGMVTGSYDLIGPGGSAGLANNSNGNIVLTSLAGLELGPLASNGGPTQTMAVLPGSLAINNGTAITGLTTDERGEPLDAPTPDIGAYQSQGYSWSVVAGSTPQTTNGGSSFGDPLAVMLTQNGTNTPVPGTSVTFTVNPASNGASASLSSTTVVSNSSGVASVTATALDVAGSFSVTATAGNLAPITFDLTVTVPAQPDFSSLTAPTITYGTASVDLGGTIAAGSQIPSGKSVVVTLNGVTQDATIGSNGSFATAFTTSNLAASATPYTVSYAFASEADFESASGTSKLTVNQAAAHIVVTSYSSTYNDQAQTATSTATGVGGVNLAADVSLSGTTHTNAGTYTDTWTFHDPNGNYQDASGTITDTIAQANATVSVTPYDVAYNGAAHAATDSATGVAGVNLAADVNLSGTTHTNAGTYTDTWTFHDLNGNYQNASGTITDTIATVKATVNVTPYNLTYNGAAHTATVSATGVADVNLASDVSLSGTTHTDAGTYTDTWTFHYPNGNYQDASGTITDTVAQANATVSVTPYDVAYNGAAHTATGSATGAAGVNLAADLNLSGTTHTNAGTYTDTWTFHDPNGNYQNASGTVIDTISASNDAGKISPTVSAATTTLLTGAGMSVYGQPAAVTVQVTANVPGAEVAAGTVELLVDGVVWTTGTLDSTGGTVISTAGIGVGAHSIVADYLGTASDGGSQSQPLAWTVDPAATSVVLATNLIVTKKGRITSVNVISHVEVNSPGTGIPTGSITLFRGKNHRITSMALRNGQTTIRLTTNQVKGQKFFVEYSGGGPYLASTSLVLSGNSILSQRPGHGG